MEARIRHNAYVDGVPREVECEAATLSEIPKRRPVLYQEAFSGAAPLSLEIIKKLKALSGSTIVEGYGMTGSTTLLTVTPWGGKLKPGSVGVPVPGTDIRIDDPPKPNVGKVLKREPRERELARSEGFRRFIGPPAEP